MLYRELNAYICKSKNFVSLSLTHTHTHMHTHTHTHTNPCSGLCYVANRAARRERACLSVCLSVCVPARRSGCLPDCIYLPDINLLDKQITWKWGADVLQSPLNRELSVVDMFYNTFQAVSWHLSWVTFREPKRQHQRQFVDYQKINKCAVAIRKAWGSCVTAERLFKEKRKVSVHVRNTLHIMSFWVCSVTFTCINVCVCVCVCAPAAQLSGCVRSPRWSEVSGQVNISQCHCQPAVSCCPAAKNMTRLPWHPARQTEPNHCCQGENCLPATRTRFQNI